MVGLELFIEVVGGCGVVEVDGMCLLGWFVCI